MEYEMKATLAENWNLFAALVVPKEATEKQVVEMKRCFYAGIHTLMIMQMNLAAENTPEQEAAEIMQGWQEELEQFALDVSEGRA